MFQWNIFPGSSSSSAITQHGQIAIEGSGNKAIIALTDNHGIITTGTLTIQDKNTLATSIQFTGKHDQIELVNTWDVYDAPDHIVIISDAVDQAIHCTKSPGFDFNKVWHSTLQKIDFFKEIGFETILAEQGVTFAQLRRMNGMSEDKIKVLMDYRGSISLIRSAGFKLSQIAHLESSKIENLLINANKLRNALKLVSREQILGENHCSPELPNTKAKAQTQWIYLPMPDRLAPNEFKFERTGSSLTVTSAPSPGFRRESDLELQAVITRQNLDDSLMARFNAQIGGQPAEKLLNDWHVFHSNEDSQEVTHYFSRTFDELITVKADPCFPIDVLCRFGQLNQFQYFKEKATLSFITDNNFPLTDAQKLFTLSDSKITLLCSKTLQIANLAKQGVTLAQLLETEEKRLNYILNNFEEAEAALIFVDPPELLGLRDSRPVLHAFSSTRNSNEREENDTFSFLKSCSLQ